MRKNLEGWFAQWPKAISVFLKVLIVLLVSVSVPLCVCAESLELLGKLQYGLDSPCAQGNYVYVDETDGIRVLDASNPQRMERLGKVPAADTNLQDIATSGTLLFASYPNGTLLIADASKPTSPTVVSVSTHKATMGSLRVVNGYVYSTWFSYGQSKSGLTIIDARNLTSPMLKSTYPIDGEVDQFCVANGKAYIANRANGLLILDVSNSTSPTFVSRYPMGDARDVAVADGYAYVANTAHLMILSKRESGVKAAPVQGEPVEGGIQILDVRQPAQPIFKAEYSLQDEDWNIGRLAISGKRLYAAGLTFGPHSGFIVFDRTNPTSLSLFSNVRLHRVKEMVVEGNRAYLENYNGLYTIDVSDPKNAKQVSFTASPSGGSDSDIAVTGNYAYTANNYAFCVVDISHPENPKICGCIPAPYEIFGVIPNRNQLAEKDGFIFVAGMAFEGFSVIDARNPYAPRLLNSQWNSAHDVVISGNHVITANGNYDWRSESLLTVWDISNPELPLKVKEVDPEGSSYSAAIDGKIIYVARKQRDGNCLSSYNISDPISPVLVSTQTLANSYCTIAAKNGLVLVSGGGGLDVFDDTSGTLHFLGKIAPPPYEGALAIAGPDDSPSYGFPVVYALGFQSFIAYSLRNPSHIFPISSYPLSGGALSVKGRNIYALCYDGIVVLEAPHITTEAKHWVGY